MIIHFRDGTEKHVPFSASNCTGYVAERITLTGEDVRRMRSLMAYNPDIFATALLQLEARFRQNRAPQQGEVK